MEPTADAILSVYHGLNICKGSVVASRAWIETVSILGLVSACTAMIKDLNPDMAGVEETCDALYVDTQSILRIYMDQQRWTNQLHKLIDKRMRAIEGELVVRYESNLLVQDMIGAMIGLVSDLAFKVSEPRKSMLYKLTDGLENVLAFFTDESNLEHFNETTTLLDITEVIEVGIKSK